MIDPQVRLPYHRIVHDMFECKMLLKLYAWRLPSHEADVDVSQEV